jgi:malic enzyme
MHRLLMHVSSAAINPLNSHGALTHACNARASQDRNGTLFYRLLVDHFVDMAPIVYDPTGALVCSAAFRRVMR